VCYACTAVRQSNSDIFYMRMIHYSNNYGLEHGYSVYGLLRVQNLFLVLLDMHIFEDVQTSAHTCKC